MSGGLKHHENRLKRLLPVSDKGKRRENLIKALLIAGMCIVFGGTIIFVIKYTGSSNSDEFRLSAGMTESPGTGFPDESSSDTSVTESETVPNSHKTLPLF